MSLLAAPEFRKKSAIREKEGENALEIFAVPLTHPAASCTINSCEQLWAVSSVG
jgi:hypothetical protein